MNLDWICGRGVCMTWEYMICYYFVIAVADMIWSPWKELHPRASAYKAVALLSELHRLSVLIVLVCLSSPLVLS
jgi:hypothetical protein